ncbi:MAG: hypothetical protein IJE40_03300 [Clostridia bacterium]|nr:hypothetical protein [Clostridia bacterium]
MRNLVDEMLKKEKKWRIVLIATTAVCLCLFFSFLAVENGAGAFFAILALIVVGFIYLSSFTRLRNYKWFLKVSENPDAVLNSFNIDMNSYTKANKVYLGDKALFHNYTFYIIPYSEIAWVYIKNTSVNYSTQVQTTVIRTRDGKLIEIPCNAESLSMIVQNYLIPQSPGVLVGFTNENGKLYSQMVKKY